MRFYLFLFTFLLVIFTTSCSSKKYLSNAIAENILIADSLYSDAKIDSIISPYKTKIDRAVAEKLIVSEIDLKTKKLGGNLGYFIADLLAEAVQKETSQKIDLVFLNSNALHSSEFKKGVISTGQMYEVMPQNYVLVYCQIKGKEIKKLFDKIIKNNDGIISKTASIFINKITNYKAFGINSLPIDDEFIYNIVTTDFIYYGGEGYEINYENTIFLKKKMRDVVIEILKEKHFNGKKIDQEIYDRIYIQ